MHAQEWFSAWFPFSTKRKTPKLVATLDGKLWKRETILKVTLGLITRGRSRDMWFHTLIGIDLKRTRLILEIMNGPRGLLWILWCVRIDKGIGHIILFLNLHQNLSMDIGVYRFAFPVYERRGHCQYLAYILLLFLSK